MKMVSPRITVYLCEIMLFKHYTWPRSMCTLGVVTIYRWTNGAGACITYILILLVQNITTVSMDRLLSVSTLDHRCGRPGLWISTIV